MSEDPGLACSVSEIYHKGVTPETVTNVLRDVEGWMHSGLKCENAEKIINCLSTLLPRALSVLTGQRAILEWNHYAILASLLSALMDAKCFLRRPLSTSDAMFCEFVLRGNPVFLIDVLVQMLQSDNNNVFLRAIFERINSLDSRHFTHPLQAIRLLVFAKWCSTCELVPKLCIREILQNRVSSAAVLTWIRRHKPKILLEKGSLDSKEPWESLQSVYDSCTIEQLVDLLDTSDENTDLQSKKASHTDLTLVTKVEMTPEKSGPNSELPKLRKNVQSESPENQPSPGCLLEPMEFDLITTPPHIDLQKSIDSFLSEMRTASEKKDQIVQNCVHVSPYANQKNLDFCKHENNKRRTELSGSSDLDSIPSTKRRKTLVTNELDEGDVTLSLSETSESMGSVENIVSSSEYQLLDLAKSHSPTNVQEVRRNAPSSPRIAGLMPSPTKCQTESIVQMAMLGIESKSSPKAGSITSTSPAHHSLRTACESLHSSALPNSTPHIADASENSQLGGFTSILMDSKSHLSETYQTPVKFTEVKSTSANRMESSPMLSGQPIIVNSEVKRASLSSSNGSEGMQKSTNPSRDSGTISNFPTRKVMSPLKSTSAISTTPIRSPPKPFSSVSPGVPKSPSSVVHSTPPLNQTQNISLKNSDSSQTVYKSPVDSEQSATVDPICPKPDVAASCPVPSTDANISDVVLEQLKFGPLDSSSEASKPHSSTHIKSTGSAKTSPRLSKKKTPDVSQLQSRTQRPQQQSDPQKPLVARQRLLRSAPPVKPESQDTTGRSSCPKNFRPQPSLSMKGRGVALRPSTIKAPINPAEDSHSVVAAFEDNGSEQVTPTKRARSSPRILSSSELSSETRKTLSADHPILSNSTPHSKNKIPNNSVSHGISPNTKETPSDNFKTVSSIQNEPRRIRTRALAHSESPKSPPKTEPVATSHDIPKSPNESGNVKDSVDEKNLLVSMISETLMSTDSSRLAVEAEKKTPSIRKSIRPRSSSETTHDNASTSIVESPHKRKDAAKSLTNSYVASPIKLCTVTLPLEIASCSRTRRTKKTPDCSTVEHAPEVTVSIRKSDKKSSPSLASTSKSVPAGTPSDKSFVDSVEVKADSTKLQSTKQNASRPAEKAKTPTSSKTVRTRQSLGKSVGTLDAFVVVHKTSNATNNKQDVLPVREPYSLRERRTLK